MLRAAWSGTGQGSALRVVVIDPGHGGDETGYTAGETTEADLVFDLASRIVGESLQDDVRQRVASVRDLARRMQRLRQDLLDVASIEQGGLSVEWDSWHPGAVVSEALAAFAPLAAEKGIELAGQVDDGVPEVEGDRERVIQVLANLLGNAVKFTPSGGRVGLRVEAAPGEVRFAVRDTGPGIAPEHQAHVWDRFWKSRTSNRHGAGLGLAIARGIVEAHGGRIWLESAVGEGSTFTFTLPLHPPPPDDEE